MRILSILLDVYFQCIKYKTFQSRSKLEYFTLWSNPVNEPIYISSQFFHTSNTDLFSRIFPCSGSFPSSKLVIQHPISAGKQAAYIFSDKFNLMNHQIFNSARDLVFEILRPKQFQKAMFIEHCLMCIVQGFRNLLIDE